MDLKLPSAEQFQPKIILEKNSKTFLANDNEYVVQNDETKFTHIVIDLLFESGMVEDEDPLSDWEIWLYVRNAFGFNYVIRKNDFVEGRLKNRHFRYIGLFPVLGNFSIRFWNNKNTDIITHITVGGY